MSTLRGQRVVIASLFLPDTVAFARSAPTSPTPGPQRIAPLGSSTAKTLSIVDDLQVKSRNPTPALRSPAQESANPFIVPPTALRRRPSRSLSRHHPEPWHIEPSSHCNGGLKNAVDSLGTKLRQKLWVGTLGTSTDSILPSARRDIQRSLSSHPQQGEGEGEEGQEEKPLVEVPEEVLMVLEKLVADVRNEVWLLSGLRVRGLLERIGRRVPRLGIVAENGCFIKTIKSMPRLTRSFSTGSGSPPPRRNLKPTHERSFSTGAGPIVGAGAGGGEWVNMVANFNLTWKTACLEILHYFAERTPGSFIEERDASIVFRFWTGAMPVDGMAEDPDRTWARRQAAEAQNHIFDSLGERYGLRIIPGNNSFLVLPNNVSRSTAVGAILHPGGPARSPLSRAWMSPDVFDAEAQSGGAGGGDVDFILAVSGDEKLLRRLNEVDGAETCSTSGRGTDARWRIGPGPKEVLDVLWGLVRSGGPGVGDV